MFKSDDFYSYHVVAIPMYPLIFHDRYYIFKSKWLEMMSIDYLDGIMSLFSFGFRATGTVFFWS